MENQLKFFLNKNSIEWKKQKCIYDDEILITYHISKLIRFFPHKTDFCFFNYSFTAFSNLLICSASTLLMMLMKKKFRYYFFQHRILFIEFWSIASFLILISLRSKIFFIFGITFAIFLWKFFNFLNLKINFPFKIAQVYHNNQRVTYKCISVHNEETFFYYLLNIRT